MENKNYSGNGYKAKLALPEIHRLITTSYLELLTLLQKGQIIRPVHW